MSSELRAAVRNVRKLSSKLNALTDQAKETIELLEKFLSIECEVGTPVYVPVKLSTDDPQNPAGTYLEYRRIGTRFRIAIVVTNPQGEDTSVKPWNDATRKTKMSAFSKLPDLLNAIAAELKERIAEAEDAAAAVSETVRELLQKDEHQA